MIDLVDNIGVLIDESIEIPDIDKEDEFIISIDNSLLNEGLERQFAEIGVIMEEPRSTSGIMGRATQAKRMQNEAAAAKKEEAQKRLDAAGDRAEERGNQREAEKQDMNNRADKLEAQSERRNQEAMSDTDTKGNVYKRDEDTDFSSKLTAANNKKTAEREINSEISKNDSNWDNKPDTWGTSAEGPGFMSAVGAAVKENPLVALGGAVLAAAGAYALYRYMNSIYRLNKATNYYKKLASSASDPAKKAKYAEKAGMYEKRLEAAKAKARENKKDYIAKTKTMQGQLAEMKKSGGDAKAVAKLEKKLASRNKVLAKIGAL